MNKFQVGDMVERIWAEPKAMKAHPDKYYTGQLARVVRISDFRIFFEKKVLGQDYFSDGVLSRAEFNKAFRPCELVQENE